MRTTTLISLVLAAGLSAGACAETETSEEMAMEESALENREAVDNFRAEARARLGDIDARIQQLRAQADSAAGEAKTEVTGQLEEFQSRSGVIAQRLETLTWTDEPSWDQLTEQINQSLDSLRQDVDRALGPDQPEPEQRPDRN